MSNLNLPLSTKCIKYLLFIFNLLFVITGIILLSVGATIHGVYGNYSGFLSDGGYLSTSAFLIAIGLIIFFVSFFGCCGAVKENFCMTITFTTLLIVIFIFEFSAAISGYILKNNTINYLEESLNVTMHNYPNNKESAKTISLLQDSFQCCGINNYTDWENILQNNSLPVSCCNSYQSVGNFSCTPENPDFYKDGCALAFGSFIQGHAVTLGGVALGIAFVQLIGIVFSCHLSKQIKQYQSV